MKVEAVSSKKSLSIATSENSFTRENKKSM